MIYRQKILVALAQELETSIPADTFHLVLFLYCHEYVEHNHYYDFIPSSQGTISLQAQEDKKVLIRKKLLENTSAWEATTGKNRYATDLDFFEKIGIQKLKNDDLLEVSVSELLKKIQENYSYYMSQLEQVASEPVFLQLVMRVKPLRLM
jgi:hypothetical protein